MTGCSWGSIAADGDASINFKLAGLALFPFGKSIVPIDQVAGREVWIRGPQPVS